MTVCLSAQQVESILDMLHAFRLGWSLTFIVFHSVLGGLTAAFGVVPLGLLSRSPLQMWLASLGLDTTQYKHRHKRVYVSTVSSLPDATERTHKHSGASGSTLGPSAPPPISEVEAFYGAVGQYLNGISH